MNYIYLIITLACILFVLTIFVTTVIIQRKDKSFTENLEYIVDNTTPFIIDLFNKYLEANKSSNITYNEISLYIMMNIDSIIKNLSEDMIPEKYKKLILENETMLKSLIVDPILKVLFNNYKKSLESASK